MDWRLLREGYLFLVCQTGGLGNLNCQPDALVCRLFLKDTAAGKAPSPIIEDPQPIAFVYMRGEVFHIVIKGRDVFMLSFYPADIRVFRAFGFQFVNH